MASAHQVRTTTLVLTVVNFITLLLSIPILVVGIWLAARHHKDCLSFLQWPIIAIGAAIFVVSLIGLVGCKRRVALLLWIYMVLLFVIILVLLAFTVFTFIVASKGDGYALEGVRFKQYRLSDFSDWFQDRVNNVVNWDKLKLCIKDRRVCSTLNAQYPALSDLLKSDLSPIQAGCCKPPIECGYKFVSPTNWQNATNPAADVDCSRWSSDPSVLCYDCNSCRAGLLRTVKKDWLKVAKVCVIVLVILVIVFAMGWFAFMNAVRDDIFRSRHGPRGLANPRGRT